MKKAYFILAVFLATCSFSYGQELGVRVGNGSAGSAAVDGVFSLSKFSRVHADISFGNGGMGIDGLWDFLYKPLSEEGFNWYAGAGPYMEINDPFFLGVAGEIGLEYHFSETPISLSIDWRPRLSIIESTEFHFEGFGINARYVFGK